MKEEKTDRRVRYTKMVLKESFISLLKQKPVNKITIKEICEGADINRATFYAHYSDQFDFLHQIENELIDDINRYLAHYSFGATNDESLHVIETIMKYIKENGELCAILLGDSGDIAFQKQIMMIVRNLSVAEWAKNTVGEDGTEYIYSFLTSGCIGVIQKWLGDGMKKSPREMAETILKLTYQGLSAFVPVPTA